MMSLRRVGLALGLAGAIACGPEPAPSQAGTESSVTTSGESSGARPGPDLGDLDGAGDGDGEHDEDDAACVPAAFVHAPDPVVIDGLPAVPIDILALDAELEFDAANATAYAQGVLTFQLGEAGGMPIFDLRQTPDELLLDGRPLATAALAHHDFGLGLDSGFVILEAELEPCSVHQLEFAYALGIPDAPSAAGLSLADARVRFDLYSSDLNPGRYLESWLPANMPWDRHPISLAVDVDAELEHALISNAAIDELAPQRWQLEFPATSTAMDPMLVLVPSDEVFGDVGEHQAANGQSIPYAIFVAVEVSTPLSVITSDALTHLDAFVLELGDYPHPALTAYVHAPGRSMEYAGATTTSLHSLEHEVFHSWWARGLSPATYADGWIDEAWDVYCTGSLAGTTTAFDWDAGPVRLHDPHPFARATPQAAYRSGGLLFAGIAELMGVDALHSAMAELYAESGPPASITTAQLERHLHCASGELPELRQAFHQFVYGLDGDAEPPPDGTCG